jgi:TonB family protein
VEPSASKPGKKSAGSGEIVHQVLPDVSSGARRTITGTIKVTVRVDVDSSGKVKAAKLTNAGPSKYFARLALQAAQRWEFAPGTDPSTWQLQFRFRRTSTQAVPQRITR